MGVDTQQLHGFDDAARKLREIPQILRRRLLRNWLAAGARVVRDEAKRAAPVLANSAKAPYRTPGTVRNAIRVRTSKQAKGQGNVGVFVNVKPAPGAKFRTTTTRLLGLKVRKRVQTRASQRGARSRTDPFYWRFLEFGTAKMAARRFLRPAAGKLGQALQVFQTQAGRWFNKINASGKVEP